MPDIPVEVWKDIPVWAKIVALFSVLLTPVIYRITPAYLKWREEVLKAGKAKVSKMPKLEYHEFFTSMGYWLNAIASEFHYPQNVGKELVTREVLRMKFTIWLKHIAELNKDMDTCPDQCTQYGSCNRLYNLNMTHFNAANAEFMEFYKTGNYTEDERKALEIYVARFAEWHADTVEQMRNRIHLVCYSDYIRSCKSKQAVIDMDYQHAFSMTIRDGSVTLEHINGDLKGLVFKGHTIQ